MLAAQHSSLEHEVPSYLELKLHSLVSVLQSGNSEAKAGP